MRLRSAIQSALAIAAAILIWMHFVPVIGANKVIVRDETKPVVKLTYEATLRFNGQANCIIWSSNGKNIVASNDSTSGVVLWRTDTWREVYRRPLAPSFRVCPTFTRDNKYVLTPPDRFDPNSYTALLLVDVENGRVVRKIDGPRDADGNGHVNQIWGRRMIASGDGSRLYVGIERLQKQCNFVIYDTKSWQIIGCWKISERFLEAESRPRTEEIAISASAGTPGQSDWRNSVQIRAVHDGALVREWSARTSADALAFSRSGNLVAGGGGAASSEDPPGASSIWVWDANTGRLVSSAAAGDHVTLVAFSPSDSYLVSIAPFGIGKRRVALYRTTDLKPLYVWPQAEGDWSAAAFSPDGKHLAISTNHAVIVYRYEEM